jgi:hypothetical protein
VTDDRGILQIASIYAPNANFTGTNKLARLATALKVEPEVLLRSQPSPPHAGYWRLHSFIGQLLDIPSEENL